MSKINQIINTQQFEFVRDRIFEILLDEIENQFILTGDYNLSISGFIERNSPIDKTELPAIVVSFAKADYNNKNQGNVDGTYLFHIDCYTNAKNSNGIDGDYLAQKNVHQLLGLCRAILEDPIYKTLGFTPPFVIKSAIIDLNIASGNKEDAMNTSMGRLGFSIMVNESSKLISPTIIESYLTSVKIDNTGKGYFYKGETYQ